MVDVEQGQRRPSTPFLRPLGPPPTPKTPPRDSRDPQTSPFERRQTPPARREPLNQAILTSLQRSRTPSIWRIRSRVASNSTPISSSVRGCSTVEGVAQLQHPPGTAGQGREGTHEHFP